MNKLAFLGIGSSHYTETADRYSRFIIEKQLLDRNLWKHFVEVFRSRADIHDSGWRGEYWGKMMRGACLAYMYTQDAELYEVLTNAVTALLETQDHAGRISTYDTEHEFTGWDMWSRKYVLTGLQHFYDICVNPELRNRIVVAMSAHADYILEKIGRAEGQKDITETSNYWLGVNSCSILETIVRLYSICGEERYLNFARYILSTGGCSGGNLIDIALEGKLYPYQYPEQKAYETMSFFEGVLAYSEITSDKKCLEAVTKFVEAVNESDITVIGCAGCTHELFDNSAKRQTEYSETIMQETCVTVTWIRLLTRMLQRTGESKYAERIETAAWNALYGSVNTHWTKQYCTVTGLVVEPVPFDSYSPLYNSKRGLGIGGYKEFSDGSYYGCCACIGSAGIALVPLTAVMRSQTGIVFLQYLSGTVNASSANGTPVQFTLRSDAFRSGKVEIFFSASVSVKMQLSLRIPAWSNDPEVRINGEAHPVSGDYVTIDRTWFKGDVITLEFHPSVRRICLNGRTAFAYGPLVLARDAAKEGEGTDLTESFSVSHISAPLFIAKEDEEEIRLTLQRDDGKTLLLTDYASCGKDWQNPNCLMTVWMNIL